MGSKGRETRRDGGRNPAARSLLPGGPATSLLDTQVGACCHHHPSGPKYLQMPSPPVLGGSEPRFLFSSRVRTELLSTNILSCDRVCRVCVGRGGPGKLLQPSTLSLDDPSFCG